MENRYRNRVRKPDNPDGYNKGSKNNLAKLNEDKVREIRDAAVTISCAELAEKYGVSASAIKKARSFTSWRHVK